MAVLEHLMVGIFSREDHSTYEWLIRTVTGVTGVKDVRPVQITNNWRDFNTEIPKCSFAILYHSKSRGRLNITDVTDSLYDEELKALYEAYGRDNVIVVIGDLEDSSDEKKASMLRELPSLGRYAKDLFLFNEIKGDRAPFQGPKINELKRCINVTARRGLFKRSFIWLIVLAVGLLIVIIVVSVHATHLPVNPSTSPPPPNATNIASHFIFKMMPTSPSTIAKVTSSFASQKMNATAQLSGYVTSTGNATKLP